MASEMDLVNQLSMKNKWSMKVNGNQINAKDLVDKFGQIKALSKVNGLTGECNLESMSGLTEATTKENSMKMS